MSSGQKETAESLAKAHMLAEAVKDAEAESRRKREARSRNGGRFLPGESGNPQGRPRKPRKVLASGELERALLEMSDRVVDVKTPTGVEQMRMLDAFAFSMIMNAINGKPSAMREYRALIGPALHRREEAHFLVRTALRAKALLETAGTHPDPDFAAAVDRLLKKTKPLY